MTDYQRRAQQHRPADPWHLGLAVRRLHRQGLSERDIGAALGLDPTAVREALALVADEPEKAA